MSSDERKELFRRTRQMLLGKTISSMKGLESANVMIDDTMEGPLRNQKVINASVTVNATGNQELTTDQVNSIRYLVAGSIAGLKVDGVTVTDRNGITYFPQQDGSLSGVDAYAQRKQKYEQEMAKKVLDLLGRYTDINVAVVAELDPNITRVIDEDKIDPKPVTVVSTEDSSTLNETGPKPSGQPGFSANATDTASVAAASRGGSSREETQDKTASYSVVSKTHTQTTEHGLTPRKIAISATVPSTYFIQLWQRQNPPANPEDPPQNPDTATLANLQTQVFTQWKALIANLLTQQGVTDPANQSVEFLAIDPPTPAPEVKPDTTAQVTAWLTVNWGTLGTLALVFVSLMVIRSMVRQMPTRVDKPRDPEPIVDEKSQPEVNKTALKRLLDFTQSGPSLRDELSRLVDEDPDTAANIVRNWIGVQD